MTTAYYLDEYEGNIPVDMMIECLNDKMIELTFALTRRDYFVFHIIPFQPRPSTTYLIAARAQLEMYRFEPRDKSGPMEVDNPDPMARLAQYAIPQEDGPSRKRQ